MIEIPPETPPDNVPSRPQPGPLLLIIAYLGFISLGLPDAIVGVAWPSVRHDFALSQKHLGLVFVSLASGYCVSSFLGGRLSQRMGIGTLLTVSSLFVFVAMCGFALAPTWPLFALCGVVWGLGSGGIDGGLNAYASHHFSTRHVNWLHACYSIGATLGPLIMTAMLVNTGSWRLGYASVGGVLFVMSVLFVATRSRWNDGPQQTAEKTVAHASIREALREPIIWFSLISFFLYTGLEFTIGQWSYSVLTESRHVKPGLAGILVGVYFGAIGAGRILFGAIADRIGVDRLVRFAMLGALLGTILFAWGRPVELGYFGLALTGLGLAPVFPCLIVRTPQRLRADLATMAIGFQVSAAMVGVVAIPGLTGVGVQFGGLEVVAIVAVVAAALMCATHECLLRRTPQAT